MKIIGHRGALGLAPENTLASIEKALEHQADEIEFDVRVTQDFMPILAHDPVVHSASGAEYTIEKHSYKVLKQHKPDLTTLEEALTLIAGRRPAVLEVKPGENLKPIVACISKFLDAGVYRAENLRLASFSFPILRDLHVALPAIPKIVNERWSGLRGTWRAKKLDTKRITMQQLWLWRGFITPMSRRGWQLSAYTLNDPVKARRWARYGLYGVVTDVPDLFESA